MKKVFTLIAGMLLICGSVSAQKKWTNVVVKGDMEGELPAYTTYDEMQGSGGEWNSFWSHEFPKGEEGEEQYQGTATIVEDPLDPSNHCARVVVRTDSAALACGNRTEADGKLASWDCQFFIVATEPILEGKLCRLSMRVRAEKDGTMETQAHWGPGDYNHYSLFGNMNVTTTWQTITTSEITVSADQSQEAKDKFFQTVAFNLSTTTEGNVIYFDDIKLEMKDDAPDDPEEEATWINLLRKGTETVDKVGNFTTFTGRNGATNRDEQAELVNDPVDGQPALKVTTVAWNAEGVLKNSEGTDSLDSDDNPVTAKYYIVDNDTILSSDSRDGKSFDDWRTQFFVTTPHKFKTNQKYKFVMWARAARTDGQPLEEEISIDTQVHTSPGGYIFWDFCGSPSLNEEWQQFVFGTDEEPNTISSDANGGQTIAFNCNKNKDVAVDLYFRFDEFSFMSNVITPSERALETASITLPLSATAGEITTGSIDLTEVLKVLEVQGDANRYVEDTKSIKVKYINPETEDDAYADVDLTAGINIDANGNWVESDANAIILDKSEDVENNILPVNITNNGVTLETGKSIDAKIAFEKDFWRYLFNVSFIDAEAYAGVSEVTVAPKNNVMYDLMGRQLTKAAKGLYIMNGKKVLVK